MTPPTSTAAIATEGLGKRFGEKAALDGLDLSVATGSVCGLLGPNGAGKTTAVRVLTTLLRPDSGRAWVAGIDVARDPAGVRSQIGLTGQAATVDNVLTGRENLIFWARLFHLSPRAAAMRADELLEQFGLTEAADRRAKFYSGGMRRRLDIASSLILAPRVFFLDEPTTGLDPRNRGEVWAALRQLVAGGTTVLMTTQYLDEADQLADTIVVVNGGRKIAEGTPSELKSTIGGDRIDVHVRDTSDLPAAAAVIARVTGSEPEVDAELRRLGAPVSNRVSALTGVVGALADAGVAVEDIGVRRPTLDEVFLHLTDTGNPNTNVKEEVAA
ncbi:ATP-binding cassette domain-containing protein [Pseudonocardia sp. TRM90224]|uniref:ATP-binding cassette domain-containing protein n=1 Tax=Pseudonocardia sp. TRM90224 TaxID=2812678 RepID=UPI001E655A95|nr:ATP-binding cassette domain-containing protein [Pseudonocardia sp. TRM90224]